MASQVGAGSSGGISKSNISSIDNTLAHPNLEFFRRAPSQQNFHYPESAQNAKESLGGQIVNQSDYPQYQENYQEQSSEPINFSLDAYKKGPEFSNDYSNQNNSYQQNNYQDNFQQNNSQFNPSNDLQQYLRREYDSRQNSDLSTKEAYRKALDQQVAEKELIKSNYENSRNKASNEISNYPFGRRIELNKNSNYYNELPSYQPKFSVNNQNSRQLTEEPHLRFNKDNIIEKPNSLVADVPFYDPVKHRTGYPQGYNYDPWGKPGSGAPLIDSNGRKFTKYTGQVWYDTLGLTFDDRAKFYADKNRPLTLEEQKHEMEVERQRKRQEELNYKGRTGDLATWITDLENKRVNKIVNEGAHLNHTQVTREKINTEFARKGHINNATKLYHDELGAQLEERNRLNKLYKLKDDVAGIEHTRKWDDWWGRPGGGAPNYDVRRRDLKETLESPRDSKIEGTSLPLGPAYNKLTNDQLLYTKSTVRSNHRNLYDNMQPMKL